MIKMRGYLQKLVMSLRAKLSEPRIEMPSNFCLMSEFFQCSKHRVWWCVNLGWIFALVVLSLALLAGVAAHFGNMNILVIDYCVKNKELLRSDNIFASVRGLAGYWGEPTWGFFQTCILPFATWLAFRFAISAGTALSDLQKKGRVSPPALTESLANLNSRWCTFICIPLFVVVCLFCFLVQSGSYRNVSKLQKNAYNKDSWDYGQTQSPFLGQLREAFNNSDEQTQHQFLIGRGREETLAKALFQKLRATGHLDDPTILPYVTKDDNGKPESVNIQKMTHDDKSAVVLSLQTAKGTDMNNPFQKFAFLTAVISSQLLTAFGWTLVAWVMIKLFWWLIFIFNALPTNDPPKPSQFKLLLTDPQKRLGLGALFDPYIIIVFLIAIYGFHYALLLADEPGTAAFTASGTGGSEISRFVNLSAICILLAAVVIGPMGIFGRRTKKLRQDRFDEITEKCGRTDDERRLIVLLREESRVSAQTTWPLKDKWFQLALTAVLAFLIIPVADKNRSLPGGLSTWGNIPKNIRVTLPSTVAKIYHIPTPE